MWNLEWCKIKSKDNIRGAYDCGFDCNLLFEIRSEETGKEGAIF